MKTLTVFLGEAAPFAVELAAHAGDGGARYSLDSADRVAAPSPGVQRFALATCPPDQPLRGRDVDPVIAWAEAQCGAEPGLTVVAVKVVPAFLRVLVACDLVAALARRGRHIAAVFGRGSDTPADNRTVRDGVAALTGQGVDAVVLVPRGVLPGCRCVAELAVPQALRVAARAGLGFHEAAFGPAELIAARASVERAEAAALQLQLVERALAFRAALWPGVGTPLDARLAARAVALGSRGMAGSAPAAGPPGPPRGVGAHGGLGAVLAPRSDAAGLEMRPARRGEAVALVPLFDPLTKVSGVVPMSPRLADALHAPRPPALPRWVPRRP